MGRHLDELAKALASGTSRRTALKRFAAGVAGAALAGTFFGRTAEAGNEFEADHPNDCQKVCREIGVKGRAFGQCVSSCTTCLNHGGTPMFINNGEVVCLNGS